tara:strand:+ start:27 stop:398 length:372 start_codon:yes stop_codon:yes gene_type:complete
MKQGRKTTGSKYHQRRKTRKHERIRQNRVALLGETKKKQIKKAGGGKKTTILREDKVNITIDGKTKKADIKNVLETPQNKFLARQNRLMKGAIIETSLGKAKITNRPTQEGNVNAILVKSESS